MYKRSIPDRLYELFSYAYQHLKPAPTQKYLKAVSRIIRPGDVIVLRNYFFERIWPGYWSHVGICLGKDRFRNHIVLQARGNGVRKVTMKDYFRARYAALLRPQLERSQITSVLRHAKKLENRAFDFTFDFSDDRRLSCTELIYVLYGRLDLLPNKLK